MAGLRSTGQPSPDRSFGSRSLTMIAIAHIPPIPATMQLAPWPRIAHVPPISPRVRALQAPPVRLHPVIALSAPHPPPRHERIIGPLAHPVSRPPHPLRIAMRPVPGYPDVAWLCPHRDDPARRRRWRRAHDQHRASPRGRPTPTRKRGRRGHDSHENSGTKPLSGNMHVLLRPPRQRGFARPTPADICHGSTTAPVPASRCATAWQPCIRACLRARPARIRYT